MADFSDTGEREVLERFLRYLGTQGHLDDSDVEALHELVNERSSPFVLEEWDQIAEQLRQQGEIELADEISADFVEGVDKAIASLTSSSNLGAEWAVFIGAGGSKPPPTNLPLVAELLPRLWQKATEINAKHLLELQERCEGLGINNIEDLLTAIDITRSAAETSPVRALVEDLLVGRSGEQRNLPRRFFPRKGHQVSGLAERLQESMQTLFSLLVGMMRMAQPNDFHKALALRARGTDQLSIMTTNYDVCVERSLSGGYQYGGIEKLSGHSTAVLKLHGSLNWFACASCDELVTATLSDIETLTRARLFPVVSQCPECNATAPHLIVPPVGTKIAEHPVLLQVRQQAESALRRVPVVIFVGYSFNEADEYVLRMVSRAVANSPTKIVVFDVDKGAVKRLTSFLTAHARGYDVNENVTFVRGDAAETFPNLVSAWKNATHQPAESSAERIVNQPVG